MKAKIFAAAVVAMMLAVAKLDAAATAESRYVSMDPCFLYDSRVVPGAKIPAHQTEYLDARGACGIPANANGIAIILVAYAADSPGWVKFWASDLPLNAAPTAMDFHITTSSYLLIRLCEPTACDPEGELHFYADATAHWIVKAVGYTVPVPVG